MKYWHELTEEEQKAIIDTEITIGEFTEQYKQPDWCMMSGALEGQWGCWSLMAGNVTGEDFCKSCEYCGSHAKLTGDEFWADQEKYDEDREELLEYANWEGTEFAEHCYALCQLASAGSGSEKFDAAVREEVYRCLKVFRTEYEWVEEIETTTTTRNGKTETRERKIKTLERVAHKQPHRPQYTS